jgi:iron(III) transport system substrate-binding protein
MSHFTRSILTVLVIVALLPACATPAAQDPTATVPPPAATTAAEPTETPEPDPTATLEPTETPEPTATTEPMATTAPKSTDANITVYISPDSLGLALEEAFEAEHGDVLIIVGGSWCRKLKAEQEAGDIQADVIYGAEPIFFKGLAKTKALMAYTSPQAANIKSEYQWDNGFFVPADLRYIGIVYNKTLVDAADVPATFAGLNDAQWNMLTTVSDATQCASAFAIAAAFAQPDMDMSFFEAAKANNTLLADRAGKLPEVVASGEAALGVGPHDAVVRLQNKAKKEGVESPVSITWAEEGVYVLPRPIAIIADENRSDEATEMAKAFVDFVFSAKGQAIVVKKGGYVPILPGVEGPKQIPTDLDLVQVDWNWAAKNKPELQAAFEAIMFGN